MSPQQADPSINEEPCDSVSGALSEQELSQPLLANDQSAPSLEGSESPTFWGLLYFKSLFFLSGLSGSTWGRFGIIFYNNVAHLSPLKIGILQGIMPLLSFLAMPCWGVLADWIRSRKRVYLICKGIGTLFLLGLAILPHNFSFILLCVSGVALFRASGVLDAFVLDYLGETHRGLYGNIRLWSSVSWGLGAVVMGYITDKYGFFLNFCLYGAMMVTMLLAVGFGLPDRSKKEQARYDHANQSETLQRPDPKLLAKAICRLPVILWLMEVIVIGSGMAMVESFLFVYLQNDFKASTRLCGWTVGVTVLFELPIFHFSQQLLQRLGHDALFIISMTAYVTRVFGYTLLTESSVHWVLPLEVLHGITFASMWIASIDFSATVAPAEWSTTVQSILSSSFGCFGSVLGSLVGGWVMQTYSASVMYRGIGCVMFGMLALHVIVWAGCGLGHDVFLKKLTQERRIEAEEHHEDRLGDADKKETLRDNKKESNDDDAV